MNECTFNDSGANIKLIESLTETYDKLDKDLTFSMEDRFNIFRSFFEGLEIGLEIGATYSGNIAFLVPSILVKIRFIITSSTDLGIKETWRLIGKSMKI